MVEVIYTTGTIAHRVGNTIYMHEDLKNYPRLHKAILDHELTHTTETFTLKELLMDINPGLPKDDVKAFRKKHFKTALYMLLPINRWGVNVNLLVIYSIMLVSIYVGLRSLIWIVSML